MTPGPPSATALLHYWFDGASDTTNIRRGHACYRRWFSGDPGIDAEVSGAFAADMEAARAGECSAWTAPREMLALVLLLDQVPRHVYRGDRRAFDSDAAAFELARRSIFDGIDGRLSLVERVFLYLPIQHSERIEDHQLTQGRWELMASRAREDGLAICDFLDAAVQAENEHLDLLLRFGRYPGRNAALGRISTAAELAHLGASARG